MNSHDINAFFSHSHANRDVKINNFFRAVCDGLNIKCHSVKVKNASHAMEKARELIELSDMFVAVVTARNMIDGRYDMPIAVREEIAIAIAHNKRMAIFVEKDVGGAGMMDDSIDKYVFDRTKLLTACSETISILDEIRKQVIEHKDTLANANKGDKFIFERTVSEVTLKRRNIKLGNYYWEYKCKRFVRFISDFDGMITFSAWPQVVMKTAEKNPIKSRVTNISISKDLNYIISCKSYIDKAEITVSISNDNHPVKGDWLEIDMIWSSKYLNPIFADEVDSENIPTTIVDYEAYCCVDGVSIPYKTASAEIIFRFPDEYYMAIGKVLKVARIVDKRTETVLPNELGKIDFKLERFCGEHVITEKVQNLAPNVIYGIVWNPPSRENFLRGLS